MALGAVLGMVLLILDSRAAVQGAAEAVGLCLSSVLPSLLPFLLLSNLILGRISIRCPPLARFFRLPEGMEGLMIPAFLGGYPLGAQAVGRAYREGSLSRSQAQTLLGYCGIGGPAFLFGMVGPLLGSVSQALALWGIQILSCLLVSRLFPAPGGSGAMKPLSRYSPGEAMDGALRALARICGWVILMGALLPFLDRWVFFLLPPPVRVLLCGLLELTGGILRLQELTDPGLRFLQAGIMLSFGGVCVALQTASVAPGLGLKGYLRGKWLQAVFSGLLCLTALKAPWILALVAVLLSLPEKSQIGSGNPREAVV